MIIGIPKEVKIDEFRVGVTPQNVALLIKEGHEVLIQNGAGVGSGFSDADYISVGARVALDAKDVYDKAALIIKVKEPQPSEYGFLNEKHTLFCYLHLAPLKELTSVLAEKKVCAIAYETVAVNNELPLLKPMSEIAGKMAPIVAAHYLSRYQGGEGVLISGADGVKPAKVLIIGAGNAGFNAANMAIGMGADVTVMNRTMPKLKQMQKLPNVKTVLYSPQIILEIINEFDIVISTVLIHGGASAPKLITLEVLKAMREGAVFVDIAIDQGGTAESSKPTTHTNPIFIQEGVLHYCVANMPGAYPKTSSVALSNATISYARKLANEGTLNAIKNDASLALGVNVYNGVVTNPSVAQTHNLEFKSIESCLEGK